MTNYKYCPFCGSQNTLILTKRTMTRLKGSKVVKGIFDVWDCEKCEESFFETWTINSYKKMTLDEAKNYSFPDGGGKYKIDGKFYTVHCDEYHMHSFKCLVEVKENKKNNPEIDEEKK